MTHFLDLSAGVLRTIVLFLVFLVAPLVGQVREQNDWFPIGGIEAMGDLFEDDQEPGLIIHSVFPGGLADKGKLKVGDTIIGVNGKMLKGKGVELLETLEDGIEAAEATKIQGRKHAICNLTIRSSSGAKRVVEIPVRSYPEHSKTCPEKCLKCAAILEETLDFLKSKQQGDGQFPMEAGSLNQQVVTVCLAGLAFAGDPRKRYSEEVKRCAEYVVANAGREEGVFKREAGGPNWNQTNWPLSFGAVFLAELAARPGGSTYKEPLQRLIDTLLKNQEASGGWAHGPGGPNSLNYLELEVMSNWALGGIGMAQRVGLKFDTGRILKGIEYVKACTTGGGVAYSTRRGQLGHGDPGRTAGAYWAFLQLERKEKIVAEMGDFFARGRREFADGHASPLLHVFAGALASHWQGKNAAREYWSIYRPYIMASRTQGGAFDARPTKESRQLPYNSDRRVGPYYISSAYAIILQLGQGRYQLLDR